ncbi:hypothetical protein, conserved, partial [Eimeria maxima]
VSSIVKVTEQQSPLKIDAAAAAIAAVCITPAARAAAAAGRQAAAAVAKLRKELEAPAATAATTAATAATAATETATTDAVAAAGGALTAAAEFILQVLAATLDAWRLSIIEYKQNINDEQNSRKKEALTTLGEVAAAVAAQQLQQQLQCIRVSIEGTLQQQIEETRRHKKSIVLQLDKSAAIDSYFNEEAIAAAKETGALQQARQAALTASRKELRKIETQMLMQAHNARKLLKALAEKRQMLLRFAAFFHRRVMPETDERAVLSRLQKLHGGLMGTAEGGIDIGGLPLDLNGEGTGGGPRRSSLGASLSDCSLFTASYPHKKPSEGIRYSLTSLLTDSPSPTPAGDSPQQQQQQQQLEGPHKGGLLEEEVQTEGAPRVCTPEKENNNAMLHAYPTDIGASIARSTAAAAAPAAAAPAAAAPAATTTAAAAAAAAAAVAATPVRVGISRPTPLPEGFVGTFSLRSLVGSRRMR